MAQPRGFRRIGFRYINIVEFNREEIKLEDYFRFYPLIPDTLPKPSSFSTRVEFPYEEGNERLTLTLASVVPKKPDTISVLLDLEYVMRTPEYVSIENISDWLEKAYERIEDAFELCITDRAREVFEEETP